ncbi:MAG: PfkB family carbohydrate kinase [Hafnia sp.]
MGDAGCYYQRSHDDAGWVEPCRVQVVDTIGAGDSHCAGLLAGLASGLTAKDSLILANHVAAYVVSFRGGDCAPTVGELTTFF